MPTQKKPRKNKFFEGTKKGHLAVTQFPNRNLIPILALQLHNLGRFATHNGGPDTFDGSAHRVGVKMRVPARRHHTGVTQQTGDQRNELPLLTSCDAKL